VCGLLPLQVSSRWFLGRALCDAWTTLDLICCTSSILHLLAISLDRYWAVTRLDYIHNRSTRRIVAMIGASWGGSVVISAPPLFIQDPPNSDPDTTGECIINQNLAYTVFSTVGAFYLPFALMMIVYVKVFRAARDRIRRKLFRNRARPETSGLVRVSPEQSRVMTQPMSATYDDVEGDQLELNIQTAACPETDRRQKDAVVVSDRVSEASVDKPDGVHGEGTLNDFIADSKKPVLGSTTCSRHFSSAAGQDWNEVETLTVDCQRRHGCSSELDVVSKQCWMAEDEKTAWMGSETCVKRPLTLAVSCDDERPPVSVMVANATLTDQHRCLDDVFETSTKPEESYTVESDFRCPNGRPTELEIDGGVGAPVCAVTSPSGDHAAARSRSRSVNCDHHCYVEDTTSGTQCLRLPRKAADRLLTPTATPVRRSSWVDLTRTLLPSAAALRIHFHGPSVAGRAAGRTARQMVEQQRERKAARTLAVITGTFVLCWLPFFIVATLRPFCGDLCHYPAPLISVIVWLGYVNSLLNPIIYTVFNADFRSAFRKILFGKYRRNQRR